jgi:holo-[acyl-carrier protein] synthase
MVLGLGVDLVEWSRIARALERWGDRFLAKIMDPPEEEALPRAPAERVHAVALAVAGKEAASKAIGTGWSRGVRWRDVVVDLGPPPRVRLFARAAEVARTLGSSGRTEARLEIRGSLAVGEVRLLS